MKLCRKCQAEWKPRKNGFLPDGTQRYKCSECGSEYTPADIETETEYEQEEDKENGKMNVTTKSLHIRTVADLIEYAGIDIKVWYPHKPKIKTSEVTISAKRSSTGKDVTYTNYHIGVEFRRFKPVEQAIMKVIKEMPKQAYRPVRERRYKDDDIMAEVSLYDHHFGKWAVSPEVPSDYTLDTAKEDYLVSLEKLAAQVKSWRPKQIVFPIGNDFMHFDNKKGTTTKGTQMDMAGRFFQVATVALQSAQEAVKMLRKIAPVHIIWVQSNHDEHATWWLCNSLEQFYINDPNITVDVTPRAIQRYIWGETFIGYEHGQIKPERLCNTLIKQFRKEICNCNFVEAHAGHYHKQQEIKWVSKDTYGEVLYQRLGALTRTDYWHYLNGWFASVRSAEASVYSKKHGKKATFYEFIKEGI